MKHLIIVDDEAYMRNNLHLLFPWQELGIHVAALVANGQEALEYLEEHPVDLILADIRMPIMDGITLARICWERKLPITIILLSAYAEFEYARSAMRYGVSAYLTKPVSYEELVEVFSKAVHNNTAGPSAINNTKPVPATLPDQDLPDQSQVYKGYYHEIVHRVQEYINNNIDTATLIGAAELVGLSASYVSTIFHRCLKQTFSDYLTKTRMQEAKRLLLAGTSIPDTAWKVGYDNPKNFIRRFRQHFDSDPADLRP